MEKELKQKEKMITTLKRQVFEGNEVRENLDRELKVSKDRVMNMIQEKEATEREHGRAFQEVKLKHEQELFILKKFKK